MSPWSSLQMQLPFAKGQEAVAKPTASADVLASEPGAGDSPADELLRAAIVDSRRKSGFLPIAEEAVQARPGDAHLLLLAAAAALLDRNPERALKFLKRFAKRFVLVNAYHLLGALALAQQNKLVLARSILESHGLDNPSLAFVNFPGGWARRAWLDRELDRIFERGKASRGRRVVSAEERRAARGKASSKPSLPRRGKATDKTTIVAASVTEAAPVGLPHIDIDIPFGIELALDPLLA